VAGVSATPNRPAHPADWSSPIRTAATRTASPHCEMKLRLRWSVSDADTNPRDHLQVTRRESGSPARRHNAGRTQDLPKGAERFVWVSPRRVGRAGARHRRPLPAIRLRLALPEGQSRRVSLPLVAPCATPCNGSQETPPRVAANGRDVRKPTPFYRGRQPVHRSRFRIERLWCGLCTSSVTRWR
jgi:hypothetical protein